MCARVAERDREPCGVVVRKDTEPDREHAQHGDPDDDREAEEEGSLAELQRPLCGDPGKRRRDGHPEEVAPNELDPAEQPKAVHELEGHCGENRDVVRDRRSDGVQTAHQQGSRNDVRGGSGRADDDRKPQLAVTGQQRGADAPSAARGTAATSIRRTLPASEYRDP